MNIPDMVFWLYVVPLVTALVLLIFRMWEPDGEDFGERTKRKK